MTSQHMILSSKGKLVNFAIIVMLDSDCTHSFILPTIVQLLSLPIVDSSSLTVVTASGAKLSTTLLCAQLSFRLQQFTFIADLRVFASCRLCYYLWYELLVKKKDDSWR
jgi:Retroviral aspartyl protease